MYDAASCRRKAARFRELAKGSDERTAAGLTELALDYEAEASRLEPAPGPAIPPAS